MNKFCIITNTGKDPDYKEAGKVLTMIEAHGGSAAILSNKKMGPSSSRQYTSADQIPEGTEAAIVLGGDGTMIQAARDLRKISIPILGINIGNVGFLTEIDMDSADEAFDRLARNEYSIESRIMLKARPELISDNSMKTPAFYDPGGMKKPASAVDTDEKECHAASPESDVKTGDYFALNDIVIMKSSTRMTTLKVFDNGELIDDYTADGIIISTPTGSTGYNLSAGGPLMLPEALSLVITPICPHALNKRSIVVRADDKIRIEIPETSAPDTLADIIADGLNVKTLGPGARVDVQVAEETTKLIKLHGMSFYEKLRLKL
ncbi:MAG: NAD(+)/NADH kinase [Lachnospiraceae bacterium]|jgi:NAD+ kinase|nr:NAD(+)/NADH kinase [Lachnospiraceae bacterium]MEE3461002.1 NAD(+)/NADH kinase [Lachnospiraceae bacterium]